MTLLTDDEMPALPHPTIGMADPTNQGRWVHYYTAEQMRARDREVERRVREKMGEGWIACSERMPPLGEEVLVWLAQPSWGQPRVALDTWDEQHEAPVAWSSATIPVGPGWDSGLEWERVTHWRPLPPPPEGAGEKR